VLQRNWFFEVYPESESGSGYLVDGEGRILTNSHVISGNAKVEVTLPADGENIRYEAKVLAKDELNDLALIQIEADHELPFLPLGSSDDLKVGQKVLAIGNPFGFEGTLTTGIISSIGRSIRADGESVLEDMIQTDAAINPGNSGGPLLDSEGTVIGVNTAIYGPSGNIGIGFAMPISRAKPLLEYVLSGGEKQKPEHPGFESFFVSGRLALALKLPPAGYLVTEIEAGSAAAAAGLRGAEREVIFGNYRIPWGGDFIVAVDGRRVSSRRFLQQAYGLKRGGDEMKLTVIRGTEEREIVVKLRAQNLRL
jgi:S1-C subfamily serine protease